MIALLLLHLAAAIAAPAIAPRLGRATFLLMGVAPLATCVWALRHAGAILAGAPVVELLRWAPDLGFDLGLRIDAFALLMIGLVSGIGVLIFVYSYSYFTHRPDVGRLAALLVAFAGAMLGLVVSDNLLALFLFWELTSITSYLLIGIDDRSAAARASALRALLVTAIGGLAMLAGFVLLGQAAGTYALSGVLAAPPQGRIADVALVLVLLGAFTKSAQAPFHFWLPGAMTAPTPVSAYLHSATMVKAGVYLIARLAPAFADAAVWLPLVMGAGFATLLIGGWRALQQTDLKLLLAHGTTSQLGLLVVLFGAGTPPATLAGVIAIAAHAAFKGALFMVVGLVDHGAGTRDLTRLQGLHRPLRAVFAVAAVTAASMAGLPPLLGFVAKENAFDALLGAGRPGWSALAAGLMTAGSALTAAYSARFLWGAFATKRPADLAPDPVHRTHAPGWAFLAPAALLAAVTVVFGVAPGTAGVLLVSAAQAIDPRVAPSALALWHGFTLALLLSAAAITGGLLLWWRRRPVEAWQRRHRLPIDAARLHDRAVTRLLVAAHAVTGHVQTGSLPMYLLVILGTAVGAPGLVLLMQIDLVPAVVLVDRPIQVAIAAVVTVATLVAIRTRHRMAALVAVSTAGYTVAFLFIVHGAPDLALTQLLIETLLLVLFVLVLRHLPATFSPRGAALWQAPRVAIAAATGLFMATVALVATAARVEVPISTAYLARASPDAGGLNVVNVILVDFRAFDTFGEIIVVVVAALGVIGLVRAARRDRGDVVEPNATTQYRPSLILDTAVRALFHTVLLFSLVLLVTGHDRPGGGFIGGLVGGAAFILVYLAGNTPRVRHAQPLAPEILLGGGITLAGLAGASGWLAAGEFLEGVAVAAEIPLAGALTLSSVFAFDVAVYLVVVGLVMALLRTIGAEEVRAS